MALVIPLSAFAQGDGPSTLAASEKRAAETVSRMEDAEKTVLTKTMLAVPLMGGSVPEGGVAGAGFAPAIPRLGIPALKETDASLGVAYLMGLRNDGGATALPSGVAMGSTWNPELLYRAGAMIGSEARAKGFNVMLAGGVNLMRDPRNGRTFEYLSEDPLQSGILVGASIAGIQSNHIISTIKHFALNGQETGRFSVDVRVSEAAARESDLLAFQIGIERGQPGSVMCAYNKVLGHKACDNDWLLNTVLKKDWRYKGYVMSDWGAVPGLSTALNGLDQQSGAQIDKAVYFGDMLAKAAKSDPAYAVRLDDMNKRILTAIYANGLDKYPATPGGAIDRKANADIAEEVARQGVVLLRNRGGALPLAAGVKRVAIIGGYADRGVLSGAGSSQVHGDKGPEVIVPKQGGGPVGDFISEQYHESSPLKALRAKLPNATIAYSEGRYISEAVTQAKLADVAIVFATQWASEGFDQPDLSLPSGQDALIAAVAEANPNTIVVLETGGPVMMPWLDKTAAVLAAWYPGARGGEAIASILIGETNPSGRLPLTFPASLDQLPRPVIDGASEVAESFDVMAAQDSKLSTNYDVEGSDLGYRWNARRGQKALFPFGFGLSYASFATGDLKVNATSASFTVRNTGKRAGATVGQVYLVSRNGEIKQRLVGFQRVSLEAGAQQKVSVAIDPRLLADWRDGGWSIAADDYAFALGDDAETLGKPVTVRMKAKHWKD
ncbi:beta-glucosidase family protein [Sphingobium boeckii]|uniref:Beta-glucosidase n=1 Tax=Sphingobium boeckii TaxID=1082345 RepID=A0A7W9AHZ7_9SPHN|nr:beta-glucosidase [Sphingobium boeckii]MBB5685933.1 beta-glucosidase [Sphingobium boeckii]